MNVLIRIMFLTFYQMENLFFKQKFLKKHTQ